MWPEDLILGILRKRRQRRQGLHSKTQSIRNKEEKAAFYHRLHLTQDFNFVHFKWFRGRRQTNILQ